MVSLYTRDFKVHLSKPSIKKRKKAELRITFQVGSKYQQETTAEYWTLADSINFMSWQFINIYIFTHTRVEEGGKKRERGKKLNTVSKTIDQPLP